MKDTIMGKIKPCAKYKPFIFIGYSEIDKEVVYRDVYELQLRGWNIRLENTSCTMDVLKITEDIHCKLSIFYVSKCSLCSDRRLKEIVLNHENDSVKLLIVEVEEIGDIVDYNNKQIRIIR